MTLYSIKSPSDMNISSYESGRLPPIGSGGLFYIWHAVWSNSSLWFLIFYCHKSYHSGVIPISLLLCSESFNNLTVSLENREVSRYTTDSSHCLCKEEKATYSGLLRSAVSKPLEKSVSSSVLTVIESEVEKLQFALKKMWNFSFC